MAGMHSQLSRTAEGKGVVAQGQGRNDCQPGKAGSVGDERVAADKGGSSANPEETDYEQDGFAAIAGADQDRESRRLVEFSKGENEYEEN